MRNLMTLVALAIAVPGVANPPSDPCAGEERRQFDFWIGEWVVLSGDARVGESRIEPVAAGCALQETWRNAKGIEGRSLNTWDAEAKHWRQFWTGGDGLVLELTGELRKGSMVLSGETRDARSGLRVPQRITWTPNADGTVRQRWEALDANGNGWATVFDGLYRRKP